MKNSVLQVALLTFQVFSGQLWLVIAILDSSRVYVKLLLILQKYLKINTHSLKCFDSKIIITEFWRDESSKSHLNALFFMFERKWI